MLPPLERSAIRALAAVAWIAIALLVHGCATPPKASEPEPVVKAGDGRMLARDDEYAIVFARADDTAQSLAQQYLGDARKSWWITETNGGAEVRAGQVVVIPLVQRNRIGVYADGFQTITVLCYHRFGSRASKLTVTPAAFTAQMEYLARNGYHVLALKELGAFIAGREPLPKKSVVITIDDGYRATHDIAYPILRKFGFPATVFLYTDFVGARDALTWAQMREMVASGLIDIQAHSKTHANLSYRLPGESDAGYRERLDAEARVPREVLERKLAVKVDAFAYPFGDASEILIERLQKRDYRLGLTVNPGANPFFADALLLQRSMVLGDQDLETFKAKLQVYREVDLR